MHVGRIRLFFKHHAQRYANQDYIVILSYYANRCIQHICIYSNTEISGVYNCAHLHRSPCIDFTRCFKK